MTKRPELHAKLVEILGCDHVYFQPPKTVRMKYPCIVYDRDIFATLYADDIPYLNTVGYLVTVIDPDPDSPIIPRMAAFPMTRFDRHYTMDNLNHDAFRVYY